MQDEISRHKEWIFHFKGNEAAIYCTHMEVSQMLKSSSRRPQRQIGRYYERAANSQNCFVIILTYWDWLCWSEHGTANAKVVGMICVWAIHWGVGPDDPCRSLPIQNILWTSVILNISVDKPCISDPSMGFALGMILAPVPTNQSRIF